MIYKIVKKNKSLKGTIDLPFSKSESNRALIIRALCEKKFKIKNLSDSEDTKILEKILTKNLITVSELRTPDSQLFDVGAAGTAMRFLTAYFSIQNEKEIILTGSDRMKNRPIKILVDTLKKLGADINYIVKKGFPPLKINGKKLSGGKIKMDGTVSSQYISALLMIAPSLKNGLEIQFSGEMVSKPYIEMTLKIMQYFGVKSKWKKNKITVPQQKYFSKIFTVESDWSAASYWYEMAAFADGVDLTLSGLKKKSLQGDSGVAKIFEQFGITTKYLENGIRLVKKSKIKNQKSKIKIDFSACPDLAQTIAATCAGLGFTAHLTGLKTLRIKETDRIAALQKELKKFGVKTEIEKDELKILRPDKFSKPVRSIETYNDHRMAMSFALLAIKFGEIKIENPDVVKKSYPKFWNDLKKIGFEIIET